MKLPLASLTLAYVLFFACIAATLMRFVVVLATCVVVLMTALHLLIVRANAASAVPHLGSGIWPVLLAFLAAITVWMAALHRRFARPR